MNPNKIEPTPDVGSWRGARGSIPFAPLALALSAVAALIVAYCRIYSTFPWYDDDGYLLVSIRSFLDGHPLYDETYSPYGPFYYAWRFLLHGLLGVPLTHDATRGVALIEWGLCGLFAALLLRRCTGDSHYGAAGGLLVFLFLEPVTKEPSHPQLLAVLLTFGAALAFTHPTARRTRIFVAGLLVGALIATKPNLGVFAGLGLALAQARTTGAGLALISVGIGTVVFPVVLLFPGFSEPTVVSYAAICALTALALLLDRAETPGFSRDPWRTRAGDAGWLLLGAGTVAAGAAAFALCRGTTLAGLLDGVLLRTLHLRSGVVGSKPFPLLMAIPAVLAVLTALWTGAFHRGRGPAAQAGALLGVGVLAVVSVGYLVTGWTPLTEGGQTRAFAGLLLGLGTPWAFLLRPARTGTEPAPLSSESARTRETLIALAVTHMAIGYPSAGTQLACGASPLVLAGLAAAHGVLRHRLGERLALRIVLSLVLVAVVGPAWAASTTYRASVPVGLPGAARLRVHQDLARQFRATAGVLRANGGPFVTVYGMNSLYLWTRIPPPTAANATLWPLYLNDAEQGAIVAALENDERALVLVATGEPYLNTDAVNDVLGRWILERTRPWLEVGPAGWQIRRRIPTTRP